jgi:hypothetical protein
MNFVQTAVLTSAICASFVFGSDLLRSPAAQGAQLECSVGKLQGHYVFTGHGENLHYGTLDFDGAGKVSGKQTSLRGDVAQRETLAGAYTLEADCTGTMTFDGQPGGVAHWDIFVTRDGKKGNMIRTDSVSAGVRTFEQ